MDSIKVGHLETARMVHSASQEDPDQPTESPIDGNLIQGMCMKAESVCQRQSGGTCTVWQTAKINQFNRMGGCPSNTISEELKENAKKVTMTQKRSMKAARGK